MGAIRVRHSRHSLTYSISAVFAQRFPGPGEQVVITRGAARIIALDIEDLPSPNHKNARCQIQPVSPPTYARSRRRRNTSGLPHHSGCGNAALRLRLPRQPCRASQSTRPGDKRASHHMSRAAGVITTKPLLRRMARIAIVATLSGRCRARVVSHGASCPGRWRSSTTAACAQSLGRARSPQNHCRIPHAAPR